MRRRAFAAIAPHLFHRTGDPILDYGSFDAVKPHIGALTSEGLDRDLDATFGYLHDQGIADTSVASWALHGRHDRVDRGAKPALGAAVSFYGSGVTEGRFGAPPLAELAATLTLAGSLRRRGRASRSSRSPGWSKPPPVPGWASTCARDRQTSTPALRRFSPITAIVSPSASVGLNSTISVPAKTRGVWPGGA